MRSSPQAAGVFYRQAEPWQYNGRMDVSMKVTTVDELHDVAEKDSESLKNEDEAGVVVDLPIAGSTDLDREAALEVDHPGFKATAGSALRGASFYKDPADAKRAAAMSALNAALDAGKAKREGQTEAYKRLNDVAIRRLKSLFVDPMFTVCGFDADEQHDYALALAADALGLGYTMPQTVVDAVVVLAPWAMEPILDAMRSTRGALWDYTPMYPDFPKQVEDAAARELILNALAHYTGDLFGLRVIPDYKPSKRLPLPDGGKMEKLGLASVDELAGVAVKLLTAGQVLSEQDKSDLKTLVSYPTIHEFIEDHEDLLEGADSRIHENVAWVAGEFDGRLHEWALSQFSLPTDVLRYACKLSGGDESLAEPTKFHLTRAQRRDVAAALDHAVEAMGERADDLSDQFARHAEEWKQLARILHPHELAAKGALSQKSLLWISKTQNGVTRSYDSRVEECYRDVADGKGMDMLLGTLAQRPGDFARRLMETYRKTSPSQHDDVLLAFSRVAGKVSTPVLVQLWNLLQYPAGKTEDVPDVRVVVSKTPKGAKAEAVENRVMTDVTRSEAEAIVAVIERALMGRKKDMLVELGPHAGEYAVPLGTRSASAGTRTPARGSRIKIDGYDKDKSIIRMFVHWHDVTDAASYPENLRVRVDLDLSAMTITADFKRAVSCWYGDLRTEDGSFVHSGDLTSAPDGAAEFIDAKVSKLREQGYRYLVMTVYSFTRQPFSVIPEASAGVMLRDEMGQRGEIFEARTVEQKFDLAHESQNSTPFMLDLETGEIIWLDLDVTASSWHSIADSGNQLVTIQAMRTAAWGSPMTVSELAALETTLVTRGKDEDGRDVLVTAAGAEVPEGSEVMKIEGWDSENTMQLL